uniref:F-box domain-containing protein n=1 Tax=Strongyloides papillosus TaxID=174720 RepID=A0A0N5BZ95_STREA
MGIERSASIYDVMRIGLIRKKILQNIVSFNDIYNLSKTCKRINFYIDEESIRRRMMWLRNSKGIFIKLKEKSNIDSDVNLLSLEEIEFEKSKRFNSEPCEGDQFPGDVININNRVNFRFINAIRRLNDNEHNIFAEKLTETMDLNCVSLKDMQYLSLWSDLFDRDISICIIGYLKHNNVRCIEIPFAYLTTDINKLKKINHNIFEGLPKLSKLIVNVSGPFMDYEEIVKSRNTIEYVLNDLSKIKGSSLVLLQTSIGDCLLIEYVKMVYKIARKYKITVRYKIECVLETSGKLIPILKKCNYFSLGKTITSLYCSLNNSIEFYGILRNLQHFVNLEKFQIEFHFFDIRKDLENIYNSNFKDLSLKHCKKLKNIFITVDYYKLSQIDSSKKEEIINNNLRYLVSLMPSTVEILKIENFTNLTKDLLEMVNNFMPNIKLLESLYVSYQDSDSFDVFKNLQYLKCISKDFIKVPETVKLFSIKQYECRWNKNSKHENERNLKAYFKKFSKSLKAKNEEYVFFNNIMHWDHYKCIIQNYNWHLS